MLRLWVISVEIQSTQKEVTSVVGVEVTMLQSWRGPQKHPPPPPARTPSLDKGKSVNIRGDADNDRDTVEH